MAANHWGRRWPPWGVDVVQGPKGLQALRVLALDNEVEPPTPDPARSQAVFANGPSFEATVKWFNAEKGYGFAALADGSGDVFLHVNALQAAGHQTVSPGATLRDALAATPDRSLRAALGAAERAAFGPASLRDDASRELVGATETWLR